MEGGTIAAGQLVGRQEGPAGARLPGIVTAILLIIVTAATQLSGPGSMLILAQRINAGIFTRDILVAVLSAVSQRIGGQDLLAPVCTRSQGPLAGQQQVVDPAEVVLINMGAGISLTAGKVVRVVVGKLVV